MNIISIIKFYFEICLHRYFQFSNFLKNLILQTLWLDVLVWFVIFPSLLGLLIQIEGVHRPMGLLALTSFMITSLLGLLFAIPKINLQHSQADTGTQPYGRLTEISDTLTKVLLGAGITTAGFSKDEIYALMIRLNAMDSINFGADLYLLVAAASGVMGFVSFFLFAKLRLEPILLRSSLEMRKMVLDYESKEKRLEFSCV